MLWDVTERRENIRQPGGLRDIVVYIGAGVFGAPCAILNIEGLN